MSNAPGCKVAKSGDPIEIGDMLGHGMELNLITGRVIGFTKEKHPAVIFRRYSNQTEKWPSGPVALTRLPYPHVHFGVWERRTSGWHALAGSVMPPGYTSPRLNARLIWHPEWSRS